MLTRFGRLLVDMLSMMLATAARYNGIVYVSRNSSAVCVGMVLGTCWLMGWYSFSITPF